MIIAEGSVIHPGLKIGTARKISPKTWHLHRLQIFPAESDAELRVLDQAVQTAKRDLEEYLASFQGPPADKEILSTHLLILQDPELEAQLKEAVRVRLESAPLAVQNTFDSITSQFREIRNDFFSQRAADYQDVQNRLLTVLAGEEQDSYDDWQPGQIAVLRDITPSQVSNFSRFKIDAYCTEQGSFTSHASILSRSLDITSVTGIAGLFDMVENGDTLILDGLEGKLIVNPDSPTLLRYEGLLKAYLAKQDKLRDIGKLPAITLSSRQIKLRCNLELLSELDSLRHLGCDGIGLYRTEYLYMGKDSLPGEDLQFEAYREAAEKTSPHGVVIRSFDLGGDKLSHLIPAPHEDNPYLGSRGIRFSLSHPDIFRTQIRAILRASAYGKIELMFPMVMDVRDFLKAREIVRECENDLKARNIDYDPQIPLGVMIEIPSAVLCADELAKHCDFFSIGTNDLTQYTLAADRNNPALAPYYLTHHPALLQLLRLTLRAAQRHGIPVSICGEMASQLHYIPLLIGMGFTELSVNPASFNQCKSVIRGCDHALDLLIGDFDFNCDLAQTEELIYQTLKPYYQI